MKYVNKRVCTRSQVWPDTAATLTTVAPGPQKDADKLVVKGSVRDIGSNGMFLKTSEYVPVNSTVNIDIQFDPCCKSSTLPLSARGKVVHSNRKGVGIRFTSIDLSLFQRIIVEKMNRQDRADRQDTQVRRQRCAS